MKRTKEKELRIMLYLPEIKPDYRDGGIQVFRFGFVTVNKTDEVRNPSISFGSEPYAAYADLEFRAQAGRACLPELKPYGEEIHYQGIYSLNLYKCEMMLKMLKRCQKIQQSFPVQPATFGQYIQLVCTGLGVDGAVQDGDQIRNSAWSSHDDCNHVFWKVTDIQWLVDTRITEFFTKHGEAMRTAA